jgi:CBS-domain-containing membrane protein
MPIKAADIMTRSVVISRPDDPVRQIAKLLCDHEISAVPVCDQNDNIVGMVSEGDLMRPFGREKMLKRAWWLNMLAEGSDLAPDFMDYVRMDGRRARDLMTKTIITASESADIAELADLMTSNHVKRLPILRDSKIVGIVSRADVVRALAYAPEQVAPAA